MSHFGYIEHHLIVAIIDHIPNGIQWLGDVKNGDMTNEPMAGTDLVGLFGRGALLDAPPVWLPKAGA